MGLRTIRTLTDPFGEGETIDVTYPSQMRLRKLMVKAHATPRLPGENKDTAEGFALMGAVVMDSVKGWSYCDEDGEPVPCTPENIEELDSKTTQWLFKELTGNEDAEGKESA